MDFQRIFLFFIFSFSVFVLWDGWRRDQQPVPVAVPVNLTTTASQNLPSVQQATPKVDITSLKSHQTGEKIIVKTDVFLTEIDTVGGQTGVDSHPPAATGHSRARSRNPTRDITTPPTS